MCWFGAPGGCPGWVPRVGGTKTAGDVWFGAPGWVVVRPGLAGAGEQDDARGVRKLPRLVPQRDPGAEADNNTLVSHRLLIACGVRLAEGGERF